MSHAIQRIVNSAVEAALEGWKNIGAEFDGTNVIKVPQTFDFMVRRLNDLEHSLQPEFEMRETAVRPNELSLDAVPAKLQCDLRVPLLDNDIFMYACLRPYCQNTPGIYEGEAYFCVKTHKFPEEVERAIKFDHEPISYSDNYIQRKGYSWSEDENNSSFKYNLLRKLPHTPLDSFLKKIKMDLKIVLALKEYEERKT